MTTVPMLAAKTGRSERTIRAVLGRLGIEKLGGTYVLSDEQIRAVLAEMRDGRGRPPVR